MTVATNKDNGAPAAGDELAQGTPGESASPVAGDLVHDESSDRYGVVIDVDPVRVLWLGSPAVCELPLRKV